MNPKLVRRAAHMYRSWLVNQDKNYPETVQSTVVTNLEEAWEKLNQIRVWSNRFFNGTVNGNRRALEGTNVYNDIAVSTIPELNADLAINLNRAIGVLKSAVGGKEVTPPTPLEAIQEIWAICEEWDDVTFRDGKLSVLIENIHLEDGREEVALGSFWIEVDLRNPLNTLDIVSVDRIESTGGLYHPHVDGNNGLCSGDGGIPMKNAILQGRLEDYFRIVESILRTYNGGSPYEKLNEWYAPDHEDETYCVNCDEWRSNESTSSCNGCGYLTCEHCGDGGGSCLKCDEWYCDECISSCLNCGEGLCEQCANHCDQCKGSLCDECISQCKSCDEPFCEECIRSCTKCGNSVCNSCMVECSTCKDELCQDCANSTCKDCNAPVCVSCVVSCDGCASDLCSDCVETCCDACGRGMCGKCSEKDLGCLLTGANNE